MNLPADGQMHHFEIFTFTKYRDLETWVRGHSKLCGNDAIQQTAYDFLLMFNSNYGSILHHL